MSMPIAASRAARGGTPGLIPRMLAGGKTLLAMFLYLYVVFALFSLHEYLVLEEHQIPFTHLGFALVNAFVLAKVMLIAEDMRLGRFLEERPLIYAVLGKSVLFALVMIATRVAEGVLVGVWHGRTLPDAFHHFVQVGFIGLLAFSTILSVTLVPFFVVRELARVPGGRQIYALMTRRDWNLVSVELKMHKSAPR